VGTIRTVLAVTLVTAAGMGAAVTARAVTARDEVPYVSVAPGGAQVPLGRTVTRAPVAGHAGFSFQAPATGRIGGESPDQMATVVLPKGAFLARRWDDRPADPVKALSDVDIAVGPVRRTTIAGMPAAFVDMKVGLRIIREYRFVHDGTLYGAGVLGDPGDAVVQDTGLAMLETWTWL